MKATHPLHMRLSDLPLWRLLVALHDAELTAGPDSSTARAVAHTISEKLRRQPPERGAREEVGRVE